LKRELDKLRLGKPIEKLKQFEERERSINNASKNKLDINRDKKNSDIAKINKLDITRDNDIGINNNNCNPKNNIGNSNGNANVINLNHPMSDRKISSTSVGN